jgi:hypothetical protein
MRHLRQDMIFLLGLKESKKQNNLDYCLLDFLVEGKGIRGT